MRQHHEMKDDCNVATVASAGAYEEAVDIRTPVPPPGALVATGDGTNCPRVRLQAVVLYLD